ncbi:MAG: hypothetical protein K6F86_07535 [Lachnospiraceae bacterium]|nr:hypothetical protein [Lachnospiraceae bacterium]
MKKIVFSTDKNYTRPIITLYGQQALFDSGADIPSCNDAEFLISEFNAKEIELPVKPFVHGVGKDKVYGRIFDVEMFKIKELMYPHLRIFVPDEPGFKTTFLLSASMFYGLSCTIDFKNSALEIVVPDEQQLVRNVIFETDGEKYFLICQ